MDKIFFFILNVIINSFLVFFTAAFLIEGLIFIFRIPKGRVSALLRLIPFYKLPFDFFLYNFLNWSFVHGVDPISGEKGSRTIGLSLGFHTSFEFPFLHFSSALQMTTSDGKTFTLADILGYNISKEVLIFVCGFVIFLSLISLLLQLHRNFKKIRIAKIMPCIENETLSSYCYKYRIQFTNIFPSPCLIGIFNPTISIPDNKELSQKEYEAIIAHEIEHFKHKDNLIRCSLHCIRSCFWWIPAKWLQKKIEEDQELACDRNCSKYAVDPLDLASAIYIFAKYSFQEHSTSSHLIKGKVHQRVEHLLQIKPKYKLYLALSLAAIWIAIAMVFSGKFWIF